MGFTNPSAVASKSDIEHLGGPKVLRADHCSEGPRRWCSRGPSQRRDRVVLGSNQSGRMMISNGPEWCLPVENLSTKNPPAAQEHQYNVDPRSEHGLAQEWD